MESGDKLCKDQRNFCSINRRLLPLKLHFLFFTAGVASFAPYLPLHAKKAGLSASAIGVLYFSVPMVAMITKPFFGWIADKYKREKSLAVSMLLTSIIFYLVISFIPSIPRECFELDCASNDVRGFTNSSDFCDSGRGFNCSVVCKRENATFDYRKEHGDCEFVKTIFTRLHDPLSYSNVICPMNSSLQCRMVCFCVESSSNEYLTMTFWIFVICFFFVGTGERVLRNLSDSMCFHMVKGNVKDFGKHRLWGTLGSGGAPFLAGYLLDVTRDEEGYNYSVAIYLSLSFMAADIVASCKLHLGENDAKSKSKGICKDVLFFFSKLRNVVCALIMCIGGMMCGFDLVYYNLFMQELGASRSLIGISLAGGVIMEIPLLFFTGNIIAFLGHFNSLALGLIFISIRLFSLAYVYNPLWALLPQILLRASTEFFSVTKASYVKQWAPPGTESTLQQLQGTIYGGAGIALGYGLGGLGFDYFGSRKTYRIMATISGATAVLTFVFSQFLRCQERKNKRCSEVTFKVEKG